MKDVMKMRVAVLAALICCGSVAVRLSGHEAQAQGRAKVPRIKQIKGNLYMIAAANETDRAQWTGGTTAVFVTSAGVVLVDTKLPGYGAEILEQVRSITDKPVTTIINSHTHFDHSGSNTEFPASIEYVAHENTRANMAREQCQPVTNCAAFKGDNQKYLPKRIFKDRLSLFSGSDLIELYHFGRGHTDGDTFVVFPTVGAMHTGDMFQRKNMPFIDTANSGGSAVEFAQTVERAQREIQGVDTIISGHSDVPLSWSDFSEYSRFYSAFVEEVQKAIKSGKSADEVAAAYKVPPQFQAFEVDPARVKGNVQAIVAEMAK